MSEQSVLKEQDNQSQEPEKEPDILKPLDNADNIKYLVTDADNNLWDWVTMHAQGMHAMAARLCTITGIAYEDIQESMKRVYMAAGTLDYSKLVESMDIIQALARDKAESVIYYDDDKKTEMVRAIVQSFIISDLLSAARKEYDAHKKETFKLYPGIGDVFRLVTEKRIQIIILTDAPHHKTIDRLKKFGLDKYVTKLFGQVQRPLRFKEEVTHCKGQEYLKAYFDAIKESVPHQTDYSDKALVSSGALRVPFEYVVMQEKERKPYINLAKRLGLDPKQVSEEVAVWGDNAEKDGGLATGIDIKQEKKAHDCESAAYIYSGYGQIPHVRIAELLNRFGSTQEVSRNLGAGDDALEKLINLQEYFIQQQIQKIRTQIVKVKHSHQVLDLLSINRAA